MYGVLVVRDASGTLGFIAAFSGMIDGAWERPGFVPPMFDRDVRASIEVPGEAMVKRLTARVEEERHSEARAEVMRSHEALKARHAALRAELKARHAEQRARRHEERKDASLDDAARHAIDQRSRADKAESRRLEERLSAEAAEWTTRVRKADRRLAALERLRTAYCRKLMQRLHDCYDVRSFSGERVPLRSLYAGGVEPPSGAGDCAAPKLLAFAQRQSLEPIALAEFWWGPPPASGGRLHGEFYGACRDKCGPLLPFMLRGLDVAPVRKFTPRASVPELSLECVFEDAHLIVVQKPCGLLSVPAKDSGVTDSVLARLRTRFPNALLVHRLDLDTSGLLLAALNRETYVALQRQFAAREVTKRYAAILDGTLTRENGVVSLPMRVDLADRPRQIVDSEHGLEAVTEFRVLERDGNTTRVALFPRTGRTHQLRVHCAHPLGLGVPILGDRLYGRGGERLFLHAELLAFRHPITGETMSFERPAPF